MKASIFHKGQTYNIDLNKPIDLSIPLGPNRHPVAWYIDKAAFTPVTDGDWIGEVSQGADVNFKTITFNPHAHGTHTETVGHISEKKYSINKRLKTFFFLAQLVTVAPEPSGDDFIISKKQLNYQMGNTAPEALIIRTLPNGRDKLNMKWSHTNWPYLEEEAMLSLRKRGIKHLLIDLPSVDKEKDDGELKAHKAFWNYEGKIRTDATITEMIYVRHTVKDGIYILNLQIAPFENDATPSKPILYQIN